MMMHGLANPKSMSISAVFIQRKYIYMLDGVYLWGMAEDCKTE
jgi:hypothetical protein